MDGMRKESKEERKGIRTIREKGREKDGKRNKNNQRRRMTKNSRGRAGVF